MPKNKNNKNNPNDVKMAPKPHNDQLGENASEEYASEHYANVPADPKKNKV